MLKVFEFIDLQFEKVMVLLQLFGVENGENVVLFQEGNGQINDFLVEFESLGYWLFGFEVDGGEPDS